MTGSSASTIHPAQRNVALLVAGCFFMEMLDGTIVTTSAPRIAQALHVSIGGIGLVITAYLVTLAVLIPLSGWIAPCSRWLQSAVRCRRASQSSSPSECCRGPAER